MNCRLPRRKFGPPRPGLPEVEQFIRKQYPATGRKESAAEIQKREVRFSDRLNYVSWFLCFYGGRNFRNIWSKEEQWAYMVQGIKEHRDDWEGYFLEEFNELITGHTRLHGSYEGISQEDVYQEARLEALTLIRKAESSEIEIKTLPGFLALHLDWWFSNYCARLNAKKAQLVVLEDENSKFTGQLRKAAAHAPQNKHLPDEDLWEQERKFLLAKHVAALNPLHQEILKALYIDQLTQAEVAAKFKYSQSQISRLKERALAQLQDRLVQEGIPREDWLRF